MLSPTANDLRTIYSHLHQNNTCINAIDLAAATGLDLKLVEAGLRMLAKMGLARNNQTRIEDIRFQLV